MVDGEVLAMTISLQSPSWQGDRTGTSISRTRVSGVGGATNRIWENPSGVLSFGDEVTYMPKGSLRGGPGSLGPPRRGQGGGRGWCPPRGPVAPLWFPFWLLEFSGEK